MNPLVTRFFLPGGPMHAKKRKVTLATDLMGGSRNVLGKRMSAVDERYNMVILYPFPQPRYPSETTDTHLPLW